MAAVLEHDFAEQFQADGEGGGGVGFEVAALAAALDEREDFVVRLNMKLEGRGAIVWCTGRHLLDGN